MVILENAIIEFEEKKSVITDENESGDAESQEIVTEMGMGKDRVKSFGREFGKKWTFGIFKIMNTFLLLLLAICAGMNIGANLFWFDILNAFPFLRIFCNDAIHCLRTPTFVQNFSGFFMVSFFSMVAYLILRWKLHANKYSLCCIAIWDLVFSCLSMPVFFIAFANYGFMAALEWKWFFPKLINSSSSSLAELTETKIDSFEEHWDYEGEYFKRTIVPVQIPDWKIEEMESRRNEIIIRLTMDSSILILLAIMIPLNLFLIIRIRKMIKRTNLLLSLSEYSQFYRESNKIDKKYTSFWPNGLFKFLFWFIPILYCILDDGLRFPHNILPVFPLSLVMFFHWLYFIRKTRFRSADDLDASKLEENVGKFRFSSMLKFDIFMSFGAIAFYTFLVDFYPIKNAFLLHLIHLIYIFISYGCELFLKGSSIQLLPKISISVNFNVIKGENEKEKKAIGKDGENGAIMATENVQQ